MNLLHRIAHAIGSRLLNFGKNIDKAAGNLVLGTPEDQTISGWSGANDKTNPVADAIADTLDAVHFGGDPRHAEDAAAEDQFVTKEREQYEKEHH